MTTSNPSTFRVFVGSELSPATGIWLDPADFSDDSEAFAYVAEKCPEWARQVQYDPETGTCGGDYCISDTDGPKVSTMADAIKLAEVLAEVSTDEEEALLAYIDNIDPDLDDLLDGFRDSYRGTFSSLGDWAEDFHEECGTTDIAGGVPFLYRLGQDGTRCTTQWRHLGRQRFRRNRGFLEPITPSPILSNLRVEGSFSKVFRHL